MAERRRRHAALPPEVREALLAFFRTDDPDADPRAFYRASRATGLHRQTCRRAWMEGAPPAQPPLREIVGAERALARRRLTAATLQERVLAASEAVVEEGARAREAEALVARSAMSLAGSLLAQLAAVAPEVGELVGAAARAAANPADPAAGLATVQKIAALARQTVDVFAAAQAAERRALGEADVRVDLRAAPAVSVEDAARELAALERALRMAREAEDRHVGGADDPVAN